MKFNEIKMLVEGQRVEFTNGKLATVVAQDATEKSISPHAEIMSKGRVSLHLDDDDSIGVLAWEDAAQISLVSA
jgi:hypothetical protein